MSFYFLPSMLLAQTSDIQHQLDLAAGSLGAGYNTSEEVAQTGVSTIVGYIVKTFLSLLGVIFICYIIYGGFLWLTAAGGEEKVTKAKNIIRDGIIGIIIILAATGIYFFVTQFLFDSLLTQQLSNPY
jgi:hypothetical protein